MLVPVFTERLPVEALYCDLNSRPAHIENVAFRIASLAIDGVNLSVHRLSMRLETFGS